MQREFSSDDCFVIMLGKQANFSKISYKGTQEKTNKKVLGKNGAYSRVRQTKNFEGEITMPQSEYEALVAALPAGKDPLDIAPFSIAVSYIDTITGYKVTDVLTGCEITEWEKSMEVDSEGMDVVCPLIIGNIELQKA